MLPARPAILVARRRFYYPTPPSAAPFSPVPSVVASQANIPVPLHCRTSECHHLCLFIRPSFKPYISRFGIYFLQRIAPLGFAPISPYFPLFPIYPQDGLWPPSTPSSGSFGSFGLISSPLLYGVCIYSPLVPRWVPYSPPSPGPPPPTPRLLCGGIDAPVGCAPRPVACAAVSILYPVFFYS